MNEFVLKKRTPNLNMMQYVFIGLIFILVIGMGIGFAYVRKDLKVVGNFEINKHYIKVDLRNIFTKDYAGLDTNIDFVQSSYYDETRGVYMRSGTQSTQYPIYYYRGEMQNNNLVFANFCWKIVRTTETGGIKIIYNGKATNNICQNSGSSSIVSNSVLFNNSQYVAYSSASAKNSIDTWYKNNLLNYTSYLEDTIFCNDLSSSTTCTNCYGSKDRLTGNPSFTCPAKNYKYTLKSGTESYNLNLNGNNLLDYPVGLLTADEVNFAGGAIYSADCFGNNTTFYLYSGDPFWTMSPENTIEMPRSYYYYYVSANGRLEGNYTNSGKYGIRPVVSLKKGTKVITLGSGEEGTVTNPYVVVES